jgi:hypothetical protein
VVSTKVGEVSGHRRCQGRNGRCYGGQEGIQPHALCSGQSIELGYALQDMVFSELACFVSRNQVPEELVSVTPASRSVSPQAVSAMTPVFCGLMADWP